MNLYEKLLLLSHGNVEQSEDNRNNGQFYFKDVNNFTRIAASCGIIHCKDCTYNNNNNNCDNYTHLSL